MSEDEIIIAPPGIDIFPDEIEILEKELKILLNNQSKGNIKLFQFDKDQINLLKTFNFPFDVMGPLTEDNIIEVSEHIANYLRKKGIGENYKFNSIGKVCDSILDILLE